MKVLLISANKYAQPYPVYPLGLDFVAASINAEHEVEILDTMGEKGFETIYETIDRYSPDVIGLSLRNIDNTDATEPKGFFQEYRELVQAVRQKTTAILVLGGSGFTLFPQEMMTALGADYGIIGEGERLGSLLDAINRNTVPSALPGVMTQSSRKALPIPWSGKTTCGFNPSAPHLGYYLKNGGILSLQTKRGCRHRCIYCTYPHIEGKNPRLLDPQKIAREARRMQDAGAQYLFITDSTFNSELDHTLAVADAFIRAKITIPWGAFFAPMIPAADYFVKLADAGLTHVEFGTESLSDPVLKAYRKPFNYAAVNTAHQTALDAGVYTAHYLLFGGPGETPETMQTTMNRASRLEKYVLFLFCGTRIYPHTELFDIAIKQGQLGPDSELTTPVFYNNPTISNDDLVRQVKKWAHGHSNRVISAGGDPLAHESSKMHARGYSGPLWELLIR